MTAEQTLDNALRTWSDNAPLAEPHLDAATLFALGGAGAVTKGAGGALRHLSLCPACQREWAEWRRARSAVSEAAGENADGLLVGCGFLLAAASPGLSEGVSLPSQCGSYRLDILPQAGESGLVLAVFEVQAPELLLEAATVSVRDRQGQMLLRGTIRDGRLARAIERLADFDLSTWTVTIDRKLIDH